MRPFGNYPAHLQVFTPCNWYLPLGHAGRQASCCLWQPSAGRTEEKTASSVSVSFLLCCPVSWWHRHKQEAFSGQSEKCKIKKKITSRDVCDSTGTSPFLLCCSMHSVETGISRTAGSFSRGQRLARCEKRLEGRVEWCNDFHMVGVGEDSTGGSNTPETGVSAAWAEEANPEVGVGFEFYVDWKEGTM